MVFLIFRGFDVPEGMHHKIHCILRRVFGKTVTCGMRPFFFEDGIGESFLPCNVEHTQPAESTVASCTSTMGPLPLSQSP